jgi:cellobiose transport system substrate-binding protein
VHIKAFAKRPRHRLRLLAALLVVGGISAAALVAGTASGSGQDKITLRVSLFGDFGYHDLYKQYEASHPNIDIKEDIQSYADHHANLAKNLAVGPARTTSRRSRSDSSRSSSRSPISSPT